MYLIAGLGNIGPEFDETRHNAGFMAIDAIAKSWRIKLKTVKHSAVFGTGEISFEDKKEKVILAKPLTFMNISGRAIKPLCDSFSIPVDRLIVVHDDIDLPVGSLRIRRNGNHAGHKGIRSIYELVDKNFIRIRIGIGRPLEKSEVVDFVLARFSKEEEKIIKEILNDTIHAIETIIFKGLEEAQRKFNR